MQEEQTQNQFNFMVERLMPEQIVNVVWSINMDLCAILYVNNTIDIYRISFKASKVYQIVEQEPIISIGFNEDTSLFYYVQPNQINVVRPSCHTKVISHKINVKDFWVGDYFKTNIKDFIFNEDHKLELQLCPVSTTHQENIDRLAFFVGQENTSSLMISWDQDGLITGSLSVIFPLFHIQAQDVITAFQTNNFEELHVITNQNSKTLRIDIYDTNVLKSGSQTIMRQGYQIAYLNELFVFLKSSLQQLYTHLQDIVKIFHLNIVSVIDNIYKKNNRNSVSVSQELLRFLRFGVCSQEIQVFLSKELNDTKVLQRVDEKITNSFQQIQDIISDSTLNVLNDMIKFISKLIGYGENPLYCNIPLKKINLDFLKGEIEYLIEVLNDLRLESAEMKLHLRNLFVWLNKNVIKNQGENENEIENTKSHLVKFQPDIRRLNTFLSDEDLFKLQNLESYYNNKYSFNSQYLTSRKQQQLIPFKQQTIDMSLVDEALLEMTNTFNQTFLEYTGTTLRQNLKDEQIESERPKVNLQDCVNNAERVWTNLFNEMIENLSTKISLKKSIHVENSDGFKLPLKRTFDQEDCYKIAFLKNSPYSNTDVVTEVIINLQTLSSSTIEYQQLSNYVISEISYNQSNQILLLLKLINTEKVISLFDYFQKDIIDEKPHHLVAQVVQSSMDQLQIESQQKFETGSITLLSSSKKGLICVVSDEKKILVLTQ